MKRLALSSCALLAACTSSLQPAPDPVPEQPSNPRPVDFPREQPSPTHDPGKRPEVVATPQLLYVNFEGATLAGGGTNATSNRSALIDCSGTVNYPAYTGTAEQRQQTLDLLKKYYRPYDITIVTTKPTSGSYSMIMMGGHSSAICFNSGGVGEALGVAPATCDVLPNAITFAFTEAANNDPFDVATTIAQEHTHSFGLEHTTDMRDMLYPFATQMVLGFLDLDMPVANVNYQTGVVTNGRSFCTGSGTQNSHRRMLEVTGPGAPDTMAPTVKISYPTDGLSGFHSDRDVSVRLSVDDDWPMNFIKSTNLIVDEGTPAEMRSMDDMAPYTFIGRFAPGMHTLKATAVDSGNNVGTSTVVHFTVSEMGAGGAGMMGTGGAGAGAGGSAGSAGSAGRAGGTAGTGGNAGAGGNAGGGGGGGGTTDAYGQDCHSDRPGCTCVGNEGNQVGVCSKNCTTASQCGLGWKCLALYADGPKWCAPADLDPAGAKTTAPASGCATTTPGAPSRLPAFLLAVVPFALRRRRAR